MGDYTSILTKLKDIERIAIAAIQNVISLIEPGVEISFLCENSDKFILEELNKIYSNIKEKGISFPTCISPNNIICNFSPYKKKPSTSSTHTSTASSSAAAIATPIVKPGDLLKIEVGVHIQNYCVRLAESHFVIHPSPSDEKEEEEDMIKIKMTSNLFSAINLASSFLKRRMSGKMTRKDIWEMVDGAAKTFNCKLLSTVENIVEKVGMKGGRILKVESKNIGKETLMGNYCCDHEEEGENPLFIVNILMSSSPSSSDKDVESASTSTSPSPSPPPTPIWKIDESSTPTIYEEILDHKTYKMKLQSSRKVYHFIKQLGKEYPIHLRELCKEVNNDASVNVGLIECKNHNLIRAIPVFAEKKGIYVAQLKFTIMMFPTTSNEHDNECDSFTNDEKKEDNNDNEDSKVSSSSKTILNNKKKKKKSSKRGIDFICLGNVELPKIQI